MFKKMIMNYLVKNFSSKKNEPVQDGLHQVQGVDAQIELEKENCFCAEPEIEKFDFEAVFLKTVPITDRRQVYICGEFYDKISSYLRIISEGKVSLAGYLNNVLANHMRENRDLINELYQSKINTNNPL
jgi:hypothetical protein